MEGPPSEEPMRETRVIYTALFVADVEALMRKYPPQHPNKYYHHSTIVFRPRHGTEGLHVGERHTIRITGRVKTEKVDALLVINPRSNNANPHITLSTAEGVQPFASNQEILDAIEAGTVIDLNDTVEVIEGYFDGTNDVIRLGTNEES